MATDITVHLDSEIMPLELVLLVNAAYIENPDPRDIHELRKKLNEMPELWAAIFDMTKVIRDNLIEQTVRKEPARMAMDKNVSTLMAGLGEEKSSALEKLLIDNIVITWLHLKYVEFQMLAFLEQSENQSTAESWEKRLSASQKRHLRACESLARVRRVMSGTPLVQVNIASDGGQQVNVGGDVVRR